MKKQYKPAHEVILERLEFVTAVLCRLQADRSVSFFSEEYESSRSRLDELCKVLEEIDIPRHVFLGVLGKLNCLCSLAVPVKKKKHCNAQVLGRISDTLHVLRARFIIDAQEDVLSHKSEKGGGNEGV